MRFCGIEVAGKDSTGKRGCNVVWSWKTWKSGLEKQCMRIENRMDRAFNFYHAISVRPFSYGISPSSSSDVKLYVAGQ